jgi:hypothetical protein
MGTLKIVALALIVCGFFVVGDAFCGSYMVYKSLQTDQQSCYVVSGGSAGNGGLVCVQN